MIAHIQQSVNNWLLTKSFFVVKSCAHWEVSMQKWRCTVCDYVYDPREGDPDSGIEPGTLFEDLPDDWVCPVCGVGKDSFEPYTEEEE